MCEIEIYCLVDGAGNYMPATSLDKAWEYFQAEFGDTQTSEGIRLLKLRVGVSLPKATTLNGTAPANAEVATMVVANGTPDVEAGISQTRWRISHVAYRDVSGHGKAREGVQRHGLAGRGIERQDRRLDGGSRRHQRPRASGAGHPGGRRARGEERAEGSGAIVSREDAIVRLKFARRYIADAVRNVDIAIGLIPGLSEVSRDSLNGVVKQLVEAAVTIGNQIAHQESQVPRG